uniref:PH domain-containing protein n=1 Tax=Sinocyclocheilus rhinocerous TaxID=307959 RepID=A0A673MFC0_9TELE
MTVFPSATVSASRSKSMVMGEASRGSPSLQEGVLKAGWLKKQRSIMKNWQLRWFTKTHGFATGGLYSHPGAV